MTHETEAPTLPPVLTADELADLLRLSRKAVYAMLARRQIPGGRKVGEAWRIHRDTVLGWLAAGEPTRRKR